MAIVITVAIEKGGVGKTATVVNLAALMAQDKKKVLCVDMDSQANTTYMLTQKKKMDEPFKKKGVCDMLQAHGFVDASHFVSETEIKGVDVIASNNQTIGAPDLMTLLSKNNGGDEPIHFLAYCLAEIAEDYDYIIIDTPPARDYMTQSALFCSDYILIPLKCDALCLDSLATTYAMVSQLEEKEDTEIKLLGIVLTMVEKTAATAYVRDYLTESDYKDDLLKTEIRKSSAVVDSTIMATPVVLSAKNSNPAKDYVELYKALKKKIKKLEKEAAING